MGWHLVEQVILQLPLGCCTSRSMKSQRHHGMDRLLLRRFLVVLECAASLILYTLAALNATSSLNVGYEHRVRVGVVPF